MAGLRERRPPNLAESRTRIRGAPLITHCVTSPTATATHSAGQDRGRNGDGVTVMSLVFQKQGGPSNVSFWIAHERLVLIQE